MLAFRRNVLPALQTLPLTVNGLTVSEILTEAALRLTEAGDFEAATEARRLAADPDKIEHRALVTLLSSKEHK